MKTILTVDDSRMVRGMVSYTLSSSGYCVVEAVDGQDGLEKAKGQIFHLVLTDQNMPKLDGLGLIRALRATDEYRQTPILMLTTESSDEMKLQGRQAGATGWLVKPFDPEKLINVVARVLGNS